VALLCAAGPTSAAPPATAAPAAVAGAAAAAGDKAGGALRAPIIAVVDVQNVLQEAKAAQGIQEAIEGLRSSYAREIGEQERQLRTAEQALGEQRLTLGPEAFAEKRREFERQVGGVQRGVQLRKEQLDQTFREAMREVREGMLRIIADIAGDVGANIVLAKQQVVIIEKSLDITSVVLERLDSALPRVDIKIPAVAEQK